MISGEIKPVKREGGMTESDYFNCLHNTKLSNGEFMSKEDAEILAKALTEWKPMDA